MDSPTRITSYQDKFASDFARLNREWLDAHDLYEEEDGVHLYTPNESILSSGGMIFVALQGERVVGTCALVKMSQVEFELIKLAVDPKVRGQGLGLRLTEHAIRQAQRLGATKVSLLSSTKLTAAVKLYQSMGFVEKSLPESQPYLTADLYMELDLATPYLAKPVV